MKTAFEISQSPVFDIATKSGILRVEFEREIKQIQLDAMKEGARRAAWVVGRTTYPAHITEDKRSAYDDGAADKRKSILKALENWTEKDL